MPANPRDALAEFLREHATHPEVVEDVLAAIEDALSRAAMKRIPRAELAEVARRLANTARELAKVIKFALLQETAKGRQMAHELHFFLRNSEFLARGGDYANQEDRHHASKEGQKFDRATGPIFHNPRALFEALQAITRSAEKLASSTAKKPVLVRKGKPVNEARIGLGVELAGLWVWATGKRPTASGAASIDHPGTLFGTFIVLVAALPPHGHLITDSDLPRFIRESALAWNKRS